MYFVLSLQSIAVFMMDEPPLRLCGLCGVESTVVYGENDREGDENAQEGDFPALTDLIKQFILIDVKESILVIHHRY